MMEPVVCMNPNNNKYNGWSRTLSSSNKIKQELQEKFKQQQQVGGDKQTSDSWLDQNI